VFEFVLYFNLFAFSDFQLRSHRLNLFISYHNFNPPPKKRPKLCRVARSTLTHSLIATSRTVFDDVTNRGVVPLRHLRHVPPPTQTVWRLLLIVYKTELTVSFCA